MKLEAKIREKGGLGRFRRAGFVPGVVYGRGVGNVNVAVGRTALEHALNEAGENTLLELSIDGEEAKHVLIHDVQRDPLKNAPIHVDFLEVRLDQKIKAQVPLEFVGESPAVKELGGVLIRNINHIEVEALPRNLPHKIEVDTSTLKTFADHLTVAGINIGADIAILADPDLIVASVVPPRSETELEGLKGEVVEDVTKVEGVVKPETEETDQSEAKKVKEE